MFLKHLYFFTFSHSLIIKNVYKLTSLEIKRYCGKVNQPKLLFRQLFDGESYTFTYLLADTETKDAVIIDPVIECVDRDAQQIRDLNLRLIYAINTHLHADHITGTGKLKYLFTNCKTIISEASGARADIPVKHGDIIKFGSFKLEVRSTPGHTNGCCTFVLPSVRLAFTGDTLLIRGCGRTDFQEGNPETLYDSIQQQIFSLPPDTLLFPAHDYKGISVTTVSEEMKFNPRLTKTKKEFVSIMNDLKLDIPRKFDISVKANKVCGLYDLPLDLQFMPIQKK